MLFRQVIECQAGGTVKVPKDCIRMTCLRDVAEDDGYVKSEPGDLFEMVLELTCNRGAFSGAVSVLNEDYKEMSRILLKEKVRLIGLEPAGMTRADSPKKIRESERLTRRRHPSCSLPAC